MNSELPQSATQFAHAVLGAPNWQPPAPRRGAQFARSAVCWLCGGSTHGQGWPLRAAITDKFTNHNASPCPSSDAVCQPCVYLSSGDAWSAYASEHPELGVKSMQPITWRSYSHVFSESGGHEVPNRARWRELLVAPPAPPFVFALSESGQKHLLFRAVVSYTSAVYPMQCEEDRLLVSRADLTHCFEAFERLYALGFSKDQIADGRYHPAQTMKAGLAAWREAEARFAPWRRRAPHLVRLARFCAQRPDQSSEGDSA